MAFCTHGPWGWLMCVRRWASEVKKSNWSPLATHAALDGLRASFFFFLQVFPEHLQGCLLVAWGSSTLHIGGPDPATYTCFSLTSQTQEQLLSTAVALHAAIIGAAAQCVPILFAGAPTLIKNLPYDEDVSPHWCALPLDEVAARAAHPEHGLLPKGRAVVTVLEMVTGIKDTRTCPPRPAPSALWDCAACTFANPRAAADCLMCGTADPARDVDDAVAEHPVWEWDNASGEAPPQPSDILNRRIVSEWARDGASPSCQRGGRWVAYADELVRDLETAYQASWTKPEHGEPTTEVTHAINGSHYTIDFLTMVQTNTVTKFVRSVRRRMMARRLASPEDAWVQSPSEVHLSAGLALVPSHPETPDDLAADDALGHALVGCVWPRMNWMQAVDVLNEPQNRYDGCFLLRGSVDDPNGFTLSVRTEDTADQRAANALDPATAGAKARPSAAATGTPATVPSAGALQRDRVAGRSKAAPAGLGRGSLPSLPASAESETESETETQTEAPVWGEVERTTPAEKASTSKKAKKSKRRAVPGKRTAKVAVAGEMTVRGETLPAGGVTGKILAADSTEPTAEPTASSAGDEHLRLPTVFGHELRADAEATQGAVIGTHVAHYRVTRDVFTSKKESGDVRVASRSISPPWGSIRFRLAPRTYAPWGCIVRVVGQTKSRKSSTHPEYITALFGHQALGMWWVSPWPRVDDFGQ